MSPKENYKPIFKRKVKRKKTNLRLLIEALLMIFIGLNLAIFLNTLPGKSVFLQFIIDTWIDFSKGFILLFESLINIGAVLIIVILLLACLLLIVGSVTRLIILTKRILSKRSSKRMILKR